VKQITRDCTMIEGSLLETTVVFFVELVAKPYRCSYQGVTHTSCEDPVSWGDGRICPETLVHITGAVERAQRYIYGLPVVYQI